MEWLSLRSIVVTHRYDRHDSPSRKKNSLGSWKLFPATLGQSPELDIGGARYVLPTIISRFDDGRPRSPTDDGGYSGGCGLAPPAPRPQHSRLHPRRADPRGGANRIAFLHRLQGKLHPTSRSTAHDDDGCVRGEGVPRHLPCDRRCRNRLAGATTRAATSGRRQNGGRNCQRFRFPWHKSRAGFQLATSSGRGNTSTPWLWRISTRRASASGAARRRGTSACYPPTPSPSPFRASSAQPKKSSGTGGCADRSGCALCSPRAKHRGSQSRRGEGNPKAREETPWSCGPRTVSSNTSGDRPCYYYGSLPVSNGRGFLWGWLN